MHATFTSIQDYKHSCTINHLLAEPLNLQGGTRKYTGRKTKAAAHKTQCHHKIAQNAHRVQGAKQKVFVKGYNSMPKDRALQISDGVFVPTLFIDTVRAHKQFDLDFPPAERAHGSWSLAKVRCSTGTH